MTERPLMTVRQSVDSAKATSGIRHLLQVEKPTIKILLYTDDPEGITNDDAFLAGCGKTDVWEQVLFHGDDFLLGRSDPA